MNDVDLGALLLAVFALILTASVVRHLRYRYRDEVFLGVTPGEFPAPGQPVHRRRVRGTSEWSGPVAVRFTPPDGVSPAVVGTVLDGRADSADLSAGLIDLAVKGYYRIVVGPRQEGVSESSPAAPSGTPGNGSLRLRLRR